MLTIEIKNTDTGEVLFAGTFADLTGLERAHAEFADAVLQRIKPLPVGGRVVILGNPDDVNDPHMRTLRLTPAPVNSLESEAA